MPDRQNDTELWERIAAWAQRGARRRRWMFFAGGVISLTAILTETGVVSAALDGDDAARSVLFWGFSALVWFLLALVTNPNPSKASANETSTPQNVA